MELTKDVEPRMRPELRRTDALRTAGMAGTFRRIFLFALYALCASVASLNAFAQGCAMCYTTAAPARPARSTWASWFCLSPRWSYLWLYWASPSAAPPLETLHPEGPESSILSEA